MTELPYHRENLAAAIQQQARKQLDQVGAEQLSLRQIARFLAVTPAAVYRHFPDKASLLAALYTEVVDELTATLRANILDSADATTMLRQMVTNLMTYAEHFPRAVAFYLTGTATATVPVSLTTVLTLYGAQRGMAVTPEMGRTVWTLLLGILVQGPGAELAVDWTVTQIEKLVH